MKNTNISLGQYLKEQRELKGLSIDEAAMETNIAKKYIEALEQDEYGFFPAEMYITGFLTSYIEILELDKDLVLSMYRRHINKEKEAPLESFYNLHNSHHLTSMKKYIRISLFVLILISMCWFIYVLLSKASGLTSEESSASASTFTTKTDVQKFSLKNLADNETFKVGLKDTVVIIDDNDKELLAIEFLGKENYKRVINFRIGQDRYSYKNGDILDADINNDRENDLRLEIISINNKDVELTMVYTQKQETAGSFFDISPYRDSFRNTTPIASVTNIHTFNAKVTVTRPVWISYQADTVAGKEKLLKPGEIVEFSFVDGARLSLGNAGAAIITFGEFTNVIRGGTAGESSQSVFYKKTENNISTLYRSQLK